MQVSWQQSYVDELPESNMHVYDVDIATAKLTKRLSHHVHAITQ